MTYQITFKYLKSSGELDLPQSTVFLESVGFCEALTKLEKHMFEKEHPIDIVSIEKMGKEAFVL